MYSKLTFDLSCGHDPRLRFGLRRQAAWRAEVERRRQRDAAFCYLCSDCTGSSLVLGCWLLELYHYGNEKKKHEPPGLGSYPQLPPWSATNRWTTDSPRPRTPSGLCNVSNGWKSPGRIRSGTPPPLSQISKRFCPFSCRQLNSIRGLSGVWRNAFPRKIHHISSSHIATPFTSGHEPGSMMTASFFKIFLSSRCKAVATTPFIGRSFFGSGSPVARVTKLTCFINRFRSSTESKIPCVSVAGRFFSARISRNISVTVTMPPRGVRRSWLTRVAMVNKSPRNCAFSPASSDSFFILQKFGVIECRAQPGILKGNISLTLMLRFKSLNINNVTGCSNFVTGCVTG
jgi:hypothetical protein